MNERYFTLFHHLKRPQIQLIMEKNNFFVAYFDDERECLPSIARLLFKQNHRDYSQITKCKNWNSLNVETFRDEQKINEKICRRCCLMPITYLASSMQINIDATECVRIVQRLSNSAVQSLCIFPFVFRVKHVINASRMIVPCGTNIAFNLTL